MKKYSNLLALFGLAGCLMLPGLAEAKPHNNPASCRLDSREFVYFQLDLSQNLNSLQLDLASSNIRDNDVLSAMSALVRANANLYDNTGRYASQHDKFVYSRERLLDLKDAADNYYRIVYYKYRNLSSHALNAYKMVQAADYAISQFDAQCSKSKGRSKSWMDGWDRIHNYQESAMVAPPMPPGPAVMPPGPAVMPVPAQPAPSVRPDANVVYRPVDSHAAPSAQPPMARPPMHGAMPMNQSSFQSFFNSVQKASFDKDRIVLIRSVIDSGNLLTCDQITRILKTMDFDANRVDAGEIMYRGVYDKNNWFKVYDAFEFASYRSQLESRIK